MDDAVEEAYLGNTHCFNSNNCMLIFDRLLRLTDSNAKHSPYSLFVDFGPIARHKMKRFAAMT